MKLPKLLDCTLRDGGYINNWNFSLHFGEALYRAVSQSGCDFIEAGFFEPGAEAGLPWVNLGKGDLLRLQDRVPGGCEIAVMINYGSVNIEDVPTASNYPAQMIRVAAPKNKAEEGTIFAAKLSQLGYKTTINYMGVSNYTNQEILGLVNLMNQYTDQIDYFYVADSFGSLFPKRTKEIFTTLRFGTAAKLGFHPHNNLQMAFANCLEAIEAGVDIIDSSVFGMGRGAGNLFTDAILAYFEKEEPDRFHLLPILQFADLYMEELKKTYSWGYSLPQLLSGIISCHPNFPTNLLREKAYTADDIYRILQHLPEGETSRFSHQMLQEIKAEHTHAQTALGVTKISQKLRDEVINKKRKALLICGGPSVVKELPRIETFIADNAPTVFSVNNPVTPVSVDGVIFCNRRRLLQYYDAIPSSVMVVFGPEIHENAKLDFDISEITQINPVEFLRELKFQLEGDPTNSAIVSVLGLLQVGFKEIYICGLDGYGNEENYYYNEADQLLGEEEKDAENHKILKQVQMLSGLKKLIDFKFVSITESRFFSNQ
ncbi:MAG: aldolase catalytic domain-containing protein [Opitutales bacterium]